MFKKAILAIGSIMLAILPQQSSAEIIHVHAKRGNLEGVFAELESGVPLEIRSTNMTSAPGVTPLFIAAKFGKIEVVKELLARGADPTIFFTVLNARYTVGTALHHAAGFGHLDVVEALIDAGADPGNYESYISTPLHLALRGGHRRVAERLISAGAPERVLAPSISLLLPDADLARGEEIANGCQICHGKPSRDRQAGTNGPNLWGVFGQVAASDPQFEYSSFLREEDLNWDAETLNHYLYSPYQFIPGTSKVMLGMENDTDRAAIIAFLATLSD